MKTTKKTISIVFPCLNEEGNIGLLIPEVIAKIPEKYSYEIIAVDDGSSDNTREILRELSSRNSKVKAIFMHRRFGHQAALKAGIEASLGDAVITMDSDFQHPPSLIPQFIHEWENGADLVCAQKRRDDTVSISLKVRRSVAYSLWKIVTGGSIPPGVSDFRLMDKTVANFINQVGERELFLRGLTMLAAKKIVTIPYDVGKRRYGKSSYTLKMFVHMFVNGFISFSIKPLRLGWILGLFITFVSVIYIAIDILIAIVNNRPIIEGFPTLVVLILGFNGLILFYMGIMAEYIGIIFKEIKHRPIYMIDEKINFK